MKSKQWIINILYVITSLESSFTPAGVVIFCYITLYALFSSEALIHINIFFGDGPVHILPYDPQCHELFAICMIVRLI